MSFLLVPSSSALLSPRAELPLCQADTARSRDQNAALAQIRRFLIVGFRRKRAYFGTNRSSSHCSALSRSQKTLKNSVFSPKTRYMLALIVADLVATIAIGPGGPWVVTNS